MKKRFLIYGAVLAPLLLLCLPALTEPFYPRPQAQPSPVRPPSPALYRRLQGQPSIEKIGQILMADGNDWSSLADIEESFRVRHGLLHALGRFSNSPEKKVMLKKLRVPASVFSSKLQVLPGLIWNEIKEAPGRSVIVSRGKVFSWHRPKSPRRSYSQMVAQMKEIEDLLAAGKDISWEKYESWRDGMKLPETDLKAARRLVEQYLHINSLTVLLGEERKNPNEESLRQFEPQ